MIEKHTPGPWHIKKVPHFSDQEFVVEIGACNLRIFTANDAADAMLISAAPDLLEALKCCWDLGIDSALVPMVKAAIAKAEGT